MNATLPVSRINLDALQSFAVFADCLNFSQAAQTLHISQPALHVKVRKLAEQLDRVLYRRVGRRLELTAHGEMVARFGRDLQARTAGFTEHLRTGTDGQPIMLAAGEAAYLYLLGKGMQRFSQRNGPPLRLLTTNRDSTIAAVRAGKAHLGVAPLESAPDDMVTDNLAAVGQVLVMPRNHGLATKRSVRLKDLAGAKLIVPPVGRPHRQMLSLMLQSANVPWDVAVEASGWELMIQFVRLGMGVAVVNAYCNIPKGLVCRPMPELPSLRFQLFHLRGLNIKPDVERLKACLIESASAYAGNGK